MTDLLARAFDRSPLLAVLRGITPAEAPAIAMALVEAGCLMIQVAWNGPDPLRSIAAIAEAVPEEVLVGAGTITEPAYVPQLANAGARLLIMPNFDPRVIAAGRVANLAVIPGVQTPTEAFAALAAHADALKLFPTEAIPPGVVAAWRDVLPASVRLMPVGRLQPEDLPAYRRAGASGIGIDRGLFTPGDHPAAVRAAARRYLEAWNAAAPDPEGALI